jgi:hypothetical protein
MADRAGAQGSSGRPSGRPQQAGAAAVRGSGAAPPAQKARQPTVTKGQGVDQSKGPNQRATAQARARTISCSAGRRWAPWAPPSRPRAPIACARPLACVVGATHALLLKLGSFCGRRRRAVGCGGRGSEREPACRAHADWERGAPSRPAIWHALKGGTALAPGVEGRRAPNRATATAPPVGSSHLPPDAAEQARPAGPTAPCMRLGSKKRGRDHPLPRPSPRTW